MRGHSQSSEYEDKHGSRGQRRLRGRDCSFPAVSLTPSFYSIQLPPTCDSKAVALTSAPLAPAADGRDGQPLSP